MSSQTRQAGRFGRSATTSRPSSGRFSRPGTSSAGSPGRFGRPTGATRPTGRTARPSPGTRSMPSLRRRQPEASGPKKAMQAIGAALPSMATGKKAKRKAKANKKPLGMAALAAGAAGLAFSQRDKITSKLGGGSSSDDQQSTTTTPMTSPGMSASPNASTYSTSPDNTSPATPTTPPPPGTTGGTL